VPNILKSIPYKNTYSQEELNSPKIYNHLLFCFKFVNIVYPLVQDSLQYTF